MSSGGRYLDEIVSMVQSFGEDLPERFESLAALKSCIEEYDCRGRRALERESGRLVGFIVYCMGFWWPLDRKAFHCSSSVGFISDIIVHPNFWRKGIGSSLVRAAEQDLVEMGAEKVTLYTGTGNLRAQAFFSNLGYVVSGRSMGSMGYLKDLVKPK